MTKDYDLIIIGAGIVGQTLAIGAANEHLNVAIVDSAPRPEFDVNSASAKSKPIIFGARVSAISLASQSLLEKLGVWGKVSRMQAYTHMHVWDTDGFGDIKFDVDTVPQTGHKNSALGHIIENNAINAALYERVKSLQNIDCYFNAQVTHMETKEQSANVTINTNAGETLIASAKLLIGSDGANSKVRETFAFKHTFWDYDHNAIVANVTTEYAHQNTARQAFTPFGPLAFLPLPDKHQSSIVFSQQSDEAMRLMALSDQEFEKALQVAINNHYGKVALNTTRVSFPLRMRYARQWTCKHVAIIGDAAHTIHPLAGQGANLGLSDVATLLDLISEHKDTLGEVSMLRKYERCRKAEALKVIATMEGFKQLFDGEQPIKKLARNIGLLGADKLPGVKSFFIRQAMG
jgi:2-octaprenylphenol hydroxylase